MMMAMSCGRRGDAGGGACLPPGHRGTWFVGEGELGSCPHNSDTEARAAWRPQGKARPPIPRRLCCPRCTPGPRPQVRSHSDSDSDNTVRTFVIKDTAQEQPTERRTGHCCRPRPPPPQVHTGSSPLQTPPSGLMEAHYMDVTHHDLSLQPLLSPRRDQESPPPRSPDPETQGVPRDVGAGAGNWGGGQLWVCFTATESSQTHAAGCSRQLRFAGALTCRGHSGQRSELSCGRSSPELGPNPQPHDLPGPSRAAPLSWGGPGSPSLCPRETVRVRIRAGEGTGIRRRNQTRIPSPQDRPPRTLL